MAGEDPPALCCDDCDDAESRRETFMSIAAIDIVFGHWIHNLIMFPPCPCHLSVLRATCSRYFSFCNVFIVHYITNIISGLSL